MTVLAVIAASALVVAVVTVIGVIMLRRHREDPWRNSELFLPHDEAVPKGGQITARYRGRPRTPGGAAETSIVAELRCEEVVGREPEAEPIARIPIEVVDMSSVDLVEADLVVRVPASDLPSSVHTRAASIRWIIAVQVRSADGTRVDVNRELGVAPRVVL